MSDILSEAATCPPWCDHHLDKAESGSRRHMTGERVFRAGNGVLVVGLEWDLVDEDEPMVNICGGCDTYLTPDEATTLGAELYRLAAIARDTATT